MAALDFVVYARLEVTDSHLAQIAHGRELLGLKRLLILVFFFLELLCCLLSFFLRLDFRPWAGHSMATVLSSLLGQRVQLNLPLQAVQLLLEARYLDLKELAVLPRVEVETVGYELVQRSYRMVLIVRRDKIPLGHTVGILGRVRCIIGGSLFVTLWIAAA